MSQSALDVKKSVSVNPEKRNRILSAAMDEFRAGYKNASTDSIVEQAGVSKGLLFHYFGSKQGLLDSVVEHSSELIFTAFSDKIDYRDPDLLEKLWQITMLQLALRYQFPALFDFLYAVLEFDEPEFIPYKPLVTQLFDSFYPDDEMLVAHSDLSIFREGVDPRYAVTSMRLTLQGYTDKIVGPDKSTEHFRSKYNDVLDGLEGYMDLFRAAFYR